MESAHAQRKNEHLSLAEKDFALNHQVHPFDQVRLIPNALPEMAVKEVKLKPAGLALPFEWPFYIEAMTGEPTDHRRQRLPRPLSQAI